MQLIAWNNKKKKYISFKNYQLSQINKYCHSPLTNAKNQTGFVKQYVESKLVDGSQFECVGNNNTIYQGM